MTKIMTENNKPFSALKNNSYRDQSDGYQREGVGEWVKREGEYNQ